MVNLLPNHTCNNCHGPVPPRVATGWRRRQSLYSTSPCRFCPDPQCAKSWRSKAGQTSGAARRNGTVRQQEECAICGGETPHRTRTVCDKPECVAAVREYGLRRAIAIRIRNGTASEKPAERLCSGFCGRTLSYTSENFGPGSGARHGLRGTCRECCRKNERDRYRRKRAEARAQKELHRQVYGAARVSSAPLAALIEREIHKYGGDTSAVFRAAGINDSEKKPESRRFREWRAGRAPSTQLALADRVLTGLGVLWFDVWDPSTRTSDTMFSDHRTVDILKWIDAVWDAQYVFEGE